MVMVKLVPTSANGFDIELYGFKVVNGKPVHEALLGTLECHSDGEHLYILHREKEFAKFSVIENDRLVLNPIEFRTYALEIRIDK
jgi:hypothetical protein